MWVTTIGTAFFVIFSKQYLTDAVFIFVSATEDLGPLHNMSATLPVLRRLILQMF